MIGSNTCCYPLRCGWCISICTSHQPQFLRGEVPAQAGQGGDGAGSADGIQQSVRDDSICGFILFAIVIDDPGSAFFTQKRIERIKSISSCTTLGLHLRSAA